MVFIALLAAACSGDARPGYDVRVEGDALVLDGEKPLRAVRVDLAWDEGTTVTAITAGEAAGRMNIFRASIDAEARTARVLISDWRKLRLPVRGEIARVDASGAVRVVELEVAE